MNKSMKLFHDNNLTNDSRSGRFYFIDFQIENSNVLNEINLSSQTCFPQLKGVENMSLGKRSLGRAYDEVICSFESQASSR